MNRFVSGASMVFLVAVSSPRPADAPLGATVDNWAVPQANLPGSSGSRGGMTTQSDITPGIAFVGVTPCRVVRTLSPNGPFGGPSLSAGSPRDFAIPLGPCAGIPANAGAYSLNITVTNTQGPGFVKVFPTGGAVPAVSTLNYNGVLPAGQAIANAAVVPAGTPNGSITVVAGVSGTDLLIDINGYFSESYNPGTAFTVASTCDSCVGVINGQSLDTTGIHYGGEFSSNSTTDGAAGVRGLSKAATGAVYGVRGQTSSTSIGAAGVLGIDSTSMNPNALAFFESSGVVGFSTNHGVQGGSTSIGVGGTLFPASGTGFIAEGDLGFTDTINNYGVFAFGDFGGTGAKFFVEPHPTDASKVIRYVALEGPESGTYFRGAGRTVGGQAVIDVPESFRMVTDEEGLTVQVTPMGELAMLAVVRKDLNQIVVRSSKDVAFDYLVHGVRRALKNFEPIAEGKEFEPRSPQGRLPAYLTEEAKRRLIANGTYNEDGSVNMETAKRFGWTREWAERQAPRTAPAPEPSAPVPNP